MKTLTTVMPVFNGEKFVANALKSLARQTRRPDRVVVLDDASTDRTVEIIKTAVEFPIECLVNEQNLGYYGNFNQGLAYAAETKYLHFLHQDDLLAPQFYEWMMRALEAAPGPSMGYCRARAYDVRQIPAEIDSRSTPALRHRLCPVSEFIMNRAELKDLCFCSVLIRPEGKAIRSRFGSEYELGSDYVFWADLALEYGLVVEVDEILLFAGQHQGTKPPNFQKLIVDQWKVMRAIEAKCPSEGLVAWLRREKLAVRYAARCAMRRKGMMQDHPEFAARIAHQVKTEVGSVHWYLGLLAAKLRGKA